MISDPLADALTKVRNAYRAGHKQVVVNHNKLIENVVKILAGENFINSYQVNERNPEIKKSRKTITLYLRYTNTGDPVLKGVQRVSTPGRRVYVNSIHLPSVFNNTGVAIISTSHGVMADRVARKAKVGGEYVCKVW
ncbi:MAG: 30S ribosomal protein S8 [Candidatus Zophobacter franzmannii]|jgi:small subunit ribosomal protein S8|nr:30S ribosomal protein S8 [Candidatus Zophobacter franzmannii]